MRKLDQVNVANLFNDVMILRKYLEKENIFSGEEETLRGKRRKIFFEKENIFFFWRRRKTENEKEENIWRRKI